MSILLTYTNGRTVLSKEFEYLTQVFMDGMPTPTEGSDTEKMIQDHWARGIFPIFLLAQQTKQKLLS